MILLLKLYKYLNVVKYISNGNILCNKCEQ